MDTIKVSDIMNHKIVIISPEKSVKAAAKLMKENDYGILPVGHNPEHLVGIITDRDITLRVTAAGKDAAHTQIADVMSPEVFTCDAQTDIEEAAQLMRENNVSRLVITHGRTATGILTLTQLVRNQNNLRISDKILHELLGARRIHRARKAHIKAAVAGSVDFDNIEGVF